MPAAQACAVFHGVHPMPQTSIDLSGKTVVVTGGLGILGSAIGSVAAKAGAKVADRKSVV